MKKLFAILFCLALLSCGSETVIIKAKDGANGLGCTIEDHYLVCADGSRFDLEQLQGEDGQDGIDGIDGIDGQDGEDGEDAIAEIYSYLLPCNHSCVDIGDGYSAKYYNKNKAKIYESSDCSGESFNLMLEEHGSEIYWVSPNAFISLSYYGDGLTPLYCIQPTPTPTPDPCTSVYVKKVVFN